jgi:ribonuclease T2
MRGRVRAAVLAALVSLLVLPAGLEQAAAQQKPDGQPGKFDFYVLALSWSPSYCASVDELPADRRTRKDPQCDGGRPYAFVVHGLWPQYERGFPSWCTVPAPRIPRSLVDTMLDLMPSPRLVFHEWDRHGTCSGLTAQAYFAGLRKARAAITIPDGYSGFDEPKTESPVEVGVAILKANPQLTQDDIAVGCDRKRLTDVRVCLSKDFTFRKCPNVVAHACRLDKVVMPAVRGG